MSSLNKNIDASLKKWITYFVTDPFLQEICLYGVMAGGKRMRPQLAILWANVFGYDAPSLYMVASAIESLHCYSLIHDDLPAMDNDDMRRGNPTIHKKYNEATAILAGDALLTLAFQILSSEEIDLSSDIKCRLITCLSSASGADGMIKGQAEDMHLIPYYHKDNIEHILQMSYRKTGALLSCSCQMGAMAAGIQDPNILSSIKEYGRLIGISFQLKDDLLDFEGDSKALGKSTQKDIDQGKVNIPVLIGVEATKEMHQRYMKHAFEIIEQLNDKYDMHHIRALTLYLTERKH